MKSGYFLILLLLVITCGCTEIRRTRTYVSPPTWLGMEEVAPKVFVNKEMPLTQREWVSRSVTEARKKIAEFFGDVISGPQILACSTEECFAGLGGGKQRGLHLGGSKILFAPRGLTIPILTHEWSHAELSSRMDARLDGIFGIPSLPTWFNEGLAVVVSGEPSHSEKVWELIIATKMTTPKLEDLVSLKEWNTAANKLSDADPATSIAGKMAVVYATAGHEVRTWHQRVGKDGLLKLIEKVKSGEDFERSFKNN
jgi:hypothetical protein